MFRKPQFWLCQVISLSFGGLLASEGFPRGDYWAPILITICMSACLTLLLTLDK